MLFLEKSLKMLLNSWDANYDYQSQVTILCLLPLFFFFAIYKPGSSNATCVDRFSKNRTSTSILFGLIFPGSYPLKSS